MTRRRRPVNVFSVLVLLVLIAAMIYVNEVVVPSTPSPFLPTPTVTTSPEIYVQEAGNLFAEGKLLPAIDSYEAAVKANPNDATVYIALARTQVFAGRYAEAQQNAENALLLSPDNAMAHAVRAWAIYFQGDYLAAEASVKRALEIEPNNAAAHAYYAEILVEQYLNNQGGLDVMDRAIEQSRIAVELAPDSVDAHRARGYVYEVTANYEEAAREYQAAVAGAPNVSDLHLRLGRVYRRLGVYDQAIESFTRANALNPSDPTPDLLISRTYAEVGEYARAVQYAEQALVDAPSDTSLHGNLGVMLYRNLEWPRAAEELSYVVNGGVLSDGTTLQPIPLTYTLRVMEYYYIYGLTLARLGRCGEAVPVFRTILATVPADETAVFNANEGLSICASAVETPTAPAATP